MKADAEAKSRLIRETLRQGQSIESSDIVNSDMVRRLSEQRVTLRTQLAEQSSTLLGQHPRIRELRAQIADLDQQIRGEAERMVRTLEADSKISSAKLDTLTASLDQLKRAAASTSDQDVQLRALEREAKAQRDLFESYLAKYREATARDSIAAAPADARIISRATVSNLPFFPKKLPILVIATLGTFCLCSAFVVTGALLGGAPAYRPVYAPDSAPVVIERAPPPRAADARTRNSDKLPPAPTLPQGPAEIAAPAHAPVAVAPPAAKVPVDDVAAALRQAGEAGRRVAVIGSAREVGTTLTAIALARSLARSARVVLVDLAFNSPNIDVISNNPSAPGISDLVRGTASFSDIITKDKFSRAHLVAAGSGHGLEQAPARLAHADRRGRRSGAELRLSRGRCRGAVRHRCRTDPAVREARRAGRGRDACARRCRPARPVAVSGLRRRDAAAGAAAPARPRRVALGRGLTGASA